MFFELKLTSKLAKKLRKTAKDFLVFLTVFATIFSSSFLAAVFAQDNSIVPKPLVTNFIDPNKEPDKFYLEPLEPEEKNENIIEPETVFLNGKPYIPYRFHVSSESYGVEFKSEKGIQKLVVPKDRFDYELFEEVKNLKFKTSTLRAFFELNEGLDRVPTITSEVTPEPSLERELLPESVIESIPAPTPTNPFDLESPTQTPQDTENDASESLTEVTPEPTSSISFSPQVESSTPLPTLFPEPISEPTPELTPEPTPESSPTSWIMEFFGFKIIVNIKAEVWSRFFVKGRIGIVKLIFHHKIAIIITFSFIVKTLVATRH